MNIQKATLHELHSLSTLFNAYRIFYGLPSNLEGAQDFLRARIENQESVIFLASDGSDPVGFVQLYPSFSSISMKRTWILNDLFVKESARKKGVGEKLLQASVTFAKETGAKGVSLETGKENIQAQRLYERFGFVKESNNFYYYSI